MVDAVDLRLVQHLEELAVQRSSRLEIAPEWLLHDDAPPAALFLSRQPDLMQLPGDLGEEARRCRQIVQIVAAGTSLGVDLRQGLLEARVGFRVIEVSDDPVETLLEPVPDVLPELTRQVGPCLVLQLLAVLLVIEPAREADDSELVGEQPGFGEIVERRDQLAPGQVARGAEDHYRAGTGRSCRCLVSTLHSPSSQLRIRHC